MIGDKKVIILTAVGSIIMILSLVGYFLWQTFGFGKMEIAVNQSEIAFQIRGDNNVYTDSKTFDHLRIGTYEISVYRTLANMYYPQTFRVEVEGNKTISPDITLQTAPGNPDVSGEEIDPFK